MNADTDEHECACESRFNAGILDTVTIKFEYTERPERDHSKFSQDRAHFTN
jgi:hypothetical protein